MKNRKIIIIIVIVIMKILIFFLYSNTRLKGLEKQADNIILSKDIEKIALKNKVGDSGGNGDYSTLRVVLVIKTKNSPNE